MQQLEQNLEQKRVSSMQAQLDVDQKANEVMKTGNEQINHSILSTDQTSQELKSSQALIQDTASDEIARISKKTERLSIHENDEKDHHQSIQETQAFNQTFPNENTSDLVLPQAIISQVDVQMAEIEQLQVGAHESQDPVDLELKNLGDEIKSIQELSNEESAEPVPSKKRSYDKISSSVPAVEDVTHQNAPEEEKSNEKIEIPEIAVQSARQSKVSSNSKRLKIEDTAQMNLQLILDKPDGTQEEIKENSQNVSQADQRASIQKDEKIQVLENEIPAIQKDDFAQEQRESSEKSPKNVDKEVIQPQAENSNSLSDQAQEPLKDANDQIVETQQQKNE